MRAGDPLERFGLFPTRAHMGGEAKLFQDGIDLIVVIARIQAYPLRALCRWLWPRDHHAFESRARQFHVMPVGPFYYQANRHDRKLTRPTIASVVVERPEPTAERPQGMCLDAGYDYDEVYAILKEFGFTAHVRPRGEEAKAIKHVAGFKARRWVVERAHSWMNRFRRLLIRWDKKPENYLAFLHFACGLIAFRAAGLFG